MLAFQILSAQMYAVRANSLDASRRLLGAEHKVVSAFWQRRQQMKRHSKPGSALNYPPRALARRPHERPRDAVERDQQLLILEDDFFAERGKLGMRNILLRRLRRLR